MTRLCHHIAIALGAAAFLIASPLGTCLAFGQSSGAHAPNRPGWKLTFDDEFNGANNSQPDPDKWSIFVAPPAGKSETAYFTPRKDNVSIRNGNLVITVRKENYVSPFGFKSQQTSGRIQTQGKFAQQYGRFEARIKLAHGQGIWNTFWMLGANIKGPLRPLGVGWPQSGEIDIMENLGKEPDTVHSTLHGPGFPGGWVSGVYKTPDHKPLSDGFHVYAMEWEPNVTRFYVDDHLFFTQTASGLKSGETWVFDHPFFLILGVAVGGDWGGQVDSTTTFPQEMLVDYVRVYQKK